jgi:hypothetical protein
MPSWSCKIVADTVTPKLRAFVKNIEPDVEKEFDAVGSEMIVFARPLAPVETGALRDSIYARASGFELEFGNAVDYGGYQEFGTRFQLGTPHIRPTLDAFSQRILDALLVGAMNALDV